jgi:outer membrane protein TolC
MTLVFLALLAGRLVAPAPDSTLTLAEAARRAIVAHPAVRAAGADLAGAAAGRRDARSLWLPQLAAQGSVTRFEEPMIVTPIHALDATEFAFDRTLVQGDLRLSWTLFDGGGRLAANRAAAAATEGRAAGLAATEADLLAEVARRYLHVLTADTVLAAQRDGVRALEAERARAARRVEEGDAAAVQLLRVEAALAEARAAEVRAAADLASARAGLARAIGLPAARLDPMAPVVGRDAAPSPRDSLLARLAAGSPVLHEARSGLEEARAGRRRATAAWLPRVDVQGGVIAYGDGAWTFSPEWQVGARVFYPVFLGGQRGAAVAAATARETAADARLRLIELRLADALDAAIAARDAADARVAALERSAAYLSEVARVEALALDAGAGVEAEFLRAEADARRARAELAEARAARILADIELARITGDLDLAWLRAHVETAA